MTTRHPHQLPQPDWTRITCLAQTCLAFADRHDDGTTTREEVRQLREQARVLCDRFPLGSATPIILPAWPAVGLLRLIGADLAEAMTSTRSSDPLPVLSLLHAAYLVAQRVDVEPGTGASRCTSGPAANGRDDFARVRTCLPRIYDQQACPEPASAC